MNTQPSDGRLPLEGGLEIYYRTLGDGEPIIFLHGGPGLWHDYLRPHMDELADGHRLVFFDQRGGGRSAAAALTVEQAAISSFVEDIERLREGLGLRSVHVVGHSWGGLLGMLYAARHPEAVRSLVLVDSAAPTPALMMKTMAKRQQRMAANAALMELATSSGFQARRPESLVQYLELMDSDSFSNPSFAKDLHLGAIAQFAGALFAVSGLLFPQMATLDVAREFGAISCPTLVIHGKDDFIPLESSERIQAGIANARLEVLDAGHFPFIEQPGRFFQLVREFLASS